MCVDYCIIENKRINDYICMTTIFFLQELFCLYLGAFRLVIEHPSVVAGARILAIDGESMMHALHSGLFTYRSIFPNIYLFHAPTYTSILNYATLGTLYF